MGDWILKVVAWGRMGEGLGGRGRLVRWFWVPAGRWRLGTDFFGPTHRIFLITIGPEGGVDCVTG